MAGKLVVVGRPNATTFWSLLGAGVTVAEAGAAKDAYLLDNPAGRVAICQVVRSFAGTGQVVEDVDAKVDP